jgi:hypothetical protein
MKDKTKCFKAWHENQGPRERNEGHEKKLHHHRTTARLGERTTSL